MGIGRILVDKDIRAVFSGCLLVFLLGFIGVEWLLWKSMGQCSYWLLIIFLLLLTGVWWNLYHYFIKQSQLLINATEKVQHFIDGETDERIECNEEGAVYKLFDTVNALTATLNAQKERELQEKVFLKDTISDISHQLKTPLAALNIYNGILHDETEVESIREFVHLSELELDRLDTLVQNLLKITRLDAGSIMMDKREENVAALMEKVKQHFEYRAQQEGKTVLLSGDNRIQLLCNHDWIIEAFDNLVKNALDHTVAGDSVQIDWRAQSSLVQIRVCDNGCGIHPEDIHYIFKRFYRSRYSKDYQGIGLGLPLVKAIIEAHHGVIEVDSELGKGTCFTVNFLNPTEL